MELFLVVAILVAFRPLKVMITDVVEAIGTIVKSIADDVKADAGSKPRGQ